MEKKKGCFVLSFDTELAWGKRENYQPSMLSLDGKREIRMINHILDILDQYQISATWAITGGLLCSKRDECSYEVFNKLPMSEAFAQLLNNNSPLVFNPAIVDYILSRKTGHEIGFHGFTHRIFREENMDKNDARREVETWLEISHRRNIHPKTVIFPRNQIGHKDIFYEYGFTSYRGEEAYPCRCYHMPLIGRFFRRFYRILNAFSIPVVYPEILDASGLVNIPSSRWLFGFNRKIESILDMIHLPYIRLTTLVKAIDKTMTDKKILHIFAHPCEFRTENDLNKLKYVLSRVSHMVKQGQLDTMTMHELANRISSE